VAREGTPVKDAEKVVAKTNAWLRRYCPIEDDRGIHPFREAEVKGSLARR
jgi:hypothetical protein